MTSEELNAIIETFCKTHGYRRAHVDEALKHVRENDWEQYQGEMRYVMWKHDHELLAALACELTKVLIPADESTVSPNSCECALYMDQWSMRCRRCGGSLRSFLIRRERGRE